MIDSNDCFENVTILFADIVNFTKYSGSVTPIEVVNMLRELFTAFDKLALEFNVFKLYTIGDCYVVIGLVNNKDRDHSEEAKNVLLMGFSMIDTIKEISSRDPKYSELNMRIGIHTVNFFFFLFIRLNIFNFFIYI